MGLAIRCGFQTLANGRTHTLANGAQLAMPLVVLLSPGPQPGPPDDGGGMLFGVFCPFFGGKAVLGASQLAVGFESQSSGPARA